MATRENQGLQIALIVFVMLVVVLSVTTYIFWKNADDQTKTAVAAKTSLDQAEAQKQELAKEMLEYKRMIVGPAADTMKLDEIKQRYEIAKQYLPDKDNANLQLLAPTILKSQQERVVTAEKDAALAKKVEAEKATLVQEKEKELAAAHQGLETASSDLKAEREKFNQETERVKGEKDQLAAQVDKQRKDSEKSVESAKANVQALTQQLGRTEQLNQGLAQKAKQGNDTNFEVFDGQISGVDQGRKVAYINLGSADGLRRQITFSVYDASTSNAASAKPKAKIEVTDVTGEHFAEARITEDSPSDLVLPNDKLYSAVWHPGIQLHFALAGFMDIDGDAGSDRELVRNIIRMNGGIIDAEVDDEGKKSGTLSVNTRYLVIGDRPTEATSQDAIKGYTNMIGEATKLGVEQISAQKLIVSMGWKNQSKTVSLGRGASSADFKAKPTGGVARESTGNVNDAFRERRPPAEKPAPAAP